MNIRTGDTDVIVLAVNVRARLETIEELNIHFGTGKHFKMFDAVLISKSIGDKNSLALPLFHSLTGCDTVSGFSGKGKKTAWTVWKIYPKLTKIIIQINDNPASIHENEVMKHVERFVVLLYERTSDFWSVNETRRKLFSHKSGIENIPPSFNALLQHVKRAVFQG